MNREIVGGGGAAIYPLQGDVASAAGSSTVTVQGIQGVPVDVSFPTGGEVLTYDATDGTLSLAAPVSSLTLETDGTVNSTQTLLNLQAGANMILAESAGTVTITGPIPGTTVTLEHNGTANSTQTLLNLTGTGGVVVSEAAGTVTINGSGSGGFASKASFLSGGRSFGSGFVYVNSTGNTMMVTASAGLDGGSAGDLIVVAYTGPSGSEIEVAGNTTSSTHAGTFPSTACCSVTFMVLNGESYYVTADALTGSGVYGVYAWTEWS